MATGANGREGRMTRVGYFVSGLSFGMIPFDVVQHLHGSIVFDALAGTCVLLLCLLIERTERPA